MTPFGSPRFTLCLLSALLCVTGGCARGDLGPENDGGVRTAPTPSANRDGRSGPFDATSPSPRDASPDTALDDSSDDATGGEVGDVTRRDTAPSDIDRPEDGGGSTGDVGDCGGRCGEGEACREGSCIDACRSEQANCGSIEFAGETVRCGTCGSGRFCNEQHACAEICQVSNAECGEVFWGGTTTSCGSCSSGSCVKNRCVQSGGYRAVAAGARHTCAVRIDGTVECWGSNGTRQLGTKQSGPLPSPVEVGSFDAAVDVAATYNHTCVETNAEAWCWGLNNYEQTGVDGTSNVPQPRQATPLQDVRDVAAGNHHSCAVLTTGDGRCWGSREFGKLGDGTSGPGSKDSPVAVAHTSNFVLLAAGSGHTCGLDEAGDVWCWGSPSSGKLGRGFGGSIPSTAPPSSEPRRVESSAGGALDDVVDLGSGGDHTCAVLQSGRVRCWGDGSDGQIGDGTTNNYSLATETQGIDDARRVAAGSGHTCVVRTNGSVACWGSNARGQLGTGDTRDRTTPTDVPNLSEVVDLAAGRQHTCAVTTTGALYCWGDNQSGQIGRGTTSTGSVVAPDRVGP